MNRTSTIVVQVVISGLAFWNGSECSATPTSASLAADRVHQTSNINPEHVAKASSGDVDWKQKQLFQLCRSPVFTEQLGTDFRILKTTFNSNFKLLEPALARPFREFVFSRYRQEKESPSDGPFFEQKRIIISSPLRGPPSN